MMGRGKVQVFGLGQCSLDHLGIVKSYPEPDSKCEFSGMVIQGGGPVATALVALSRWGITCIFTGVVGNDPAGEEILSSLSEEGVDPSGVIVREGSSSQFAFIAAEEATGSRTIFWHPPTGKGPEPGDIDISALKEADVFLTDGLFMETSIWACREASRNGVRTVVDAGTLREGILDLASECDYFIASESFARSLAGKGKEQQACRLIADLGPQVTAVTMGERGYVAMIEGRITERPAYPVSALDTTGCGDVFHAGFTYGLLNRWPPAKCLDFGSWAASRVSLQLGGRAGIPDAADYQTADQDCDSEHEPS